MTKQQAPVSKEVYETIDLDAIADETVRKQNIFLNPERFEFGQRVAKMLSASKFVPETFRGSVGDCAIALNMADHLGVDPVLLMQHMHVIHGRPGIDAQMSIALFNRLKTWTAIEYEDNGKDGDAYAMTAKSTDLKTGKTHYGPPVSWSMVKAEGWYQKNGSKWKTISELMFRYRSAAWLIRTICPEATLGLMTVEELRDMSPTQAMSGKTDLSKELEPPKAEPEAAEAPETALQKYERLLKEDTSGIAQAADECGLEDVKTDEDAARVIEAWEATG